MFRTTHIRTKLALALAVPMVALVAVAGFEVLDAKAQVDEAKSQAELAEASIGPGSLVVHLQNERNRASINLIGLGDAAEPAVADNPEARGFTDPAAVEFRKETGSRGGVVTKAFEPAWSAFEALDALRAEIDAYAGPMDSTNDVFADDVFQRYTNIIEPFLDGTSQVALTEATRLQADAVARERLFAGIALGGLLLALLVTWLASRSITRPLRSLKAQAEEMAGARLPAAVRQILDTPAGEDVVIPEVQPITVKTRDEVSEVAAALSQVQSSAVDLAVEQAVLRRNISDSYINLGRRNQNLLSRQLDFITDLERNETDPDSLEGLFRLDHLATRMRRNAESLLVLAGIEPPRQWSAPVKVADVVRAALGEVEDYQRVVVRHLEPAALTGAVGADLAHVLAELLENALSFSPPGQSVEVKGRLTTAGYTVAIADNGLGMAPEDVERANRRLAGKESFTVAPSKYLGHYVAGHLASRLGVVVELQDSPAGGITARIDLPMGLLADEELDRTPAKAPVPPPAAAEPVTAGPAPTAVSTETTASGLPRRGERARPLIAGVDAPGLEPSVIPMAPVAPAPAPEPVAPEPAVAEPVVAANSTPSPVAPAGQSLLPSSGFGGLGVSRPSGPSMYTVAANNARSNSNREATSSGLARRVPGAQRPDVGMATRGVEPAPVESVRSSPEDVYSLLSNFQSGVARGRADAASETPTESQEDGR